MLGRVPKRIWLYWQQGWELAPAIPRACLTSWQQRNPEWEVISVDAHSLPNYVQLPKKHFRHKASASAMSDIVRINLLYQHGGVWVDSTVWCHKPLDHWLAPSFFGFSVPTADRPIATWFLAAASDSYLVKRWMEKTNHYWSKPSKNKPYFWFNMLFSELYRSDSVFKELWDDKVKIPCCIRQHEGPHYFAPYTAERMRAITPGFEEFLSSTDTPVFKLSLHHGLEQYVAVQRLMATL